MNFDTVNDRKKRDKKKEKGMEGAGNRKGKKGEMEIRVQWRLTTEYRDFSMRIQRSLSGEPPPM